MKIRETIRKQDNFRQNENPLPEDWENMYLKLRKACLDDLVNLKKLPEQISELVLDFLDR